MGTWGPSAFENDAALDFAHEIESAEDLANALTIRAPDQPIDADTACRIVVVAECVAAMPFNLAMHDLIERLNLPPVDASTREMKAKKPVINRSPCSFCAEPMGEAQFSQFSIVVDLGNGVPMTHGGGCIFAASTGRCTRGT